jgi:putative ABC transport system ATP-binding protein
LGLDFETGIAGSRLSGSQRIRIGIGRTLLKRPDLLIIDGAIAGLDPASQAVITDNILNRWADVGQIWVVGDEQDVSGFDHVVVMENGRIAEHRVHGERSGSHRLAQAMSAE